MSATETITYTRRRQSYTVVCALADCPFCHNQAFTTASARRKWCCTEAHSEDRRRQRAQRAIQAGRNPGMPGQPALEDTSDDLVGVFYLLQADEQAQVQVGWHADWRSYLSWRDALDAPHIGEVFADLVRHPIALLTKLRRTMKAYLAGRWFILKPTEIAIWQQMIAEHQGAFPMKQSHE